MDGLDGVGSPGGVRYRAPLMRFSVLLIQVQENKSWSVCVADTKDWRELESEDKGGEPWRQQRAG